MRAAVRRLPPRERDVLICVWAGLASAEAAQALGVPEGTVRTRLARARRHLRAFTGDAGTQAGRDAPRRPEAPGPPDAVRQEKTS